MRSSACTWRSGDASREPEEVLVELVFRMMRGFVVSDRAGQASFRLSTCMNVGKALLSLQPNLGVSTTRCSSTNSCTLKSIQDPPSEPHVSNCFEYAL